MEGEAFVRLEKLLGRELEQSEKERLQRIQDVLKIGPNDALWSIIAALEYQRAYYEELPQKIRTATEEILAEWSEAARKNAAAPQKTKLKKAGEQTNVISLKELVQPWFTLPVGILMGLLCMSVCVMEGIRAAKAFADTDSSWRKHALAATALLVPGAWSVSVAVF